MKGPTVGALFALLVGTIPATAQAQVELTANAGIVSDYRFRGVSLSNLDPAVQGGVDAETDSGLFAGAWVSTIADYEGAEVEVDVYGGYQRSVAGIDLAAGAYFYLYPRGDSPSYVELQGTAERSLGPATLGVEVAWGPRQANAATENLYLGASGAIGLPGSGLTLRVRSGREHGFYDEKWDWELGVSYARGPFTAALSYVDTNQNASEEAGDLAAAGVVLSLLAEF